MMIPTLGKLEKALQIRLQIAALEQELATLFFNGIDENSPAPRALPEKASRVKRKYTRQDTSGTPARGGLERAVLEVLRKSNVPLRVSDICQQLLSQKYPFTSANPKKTLGVRMYQFKNVKKLGGGLFTA